MVIAAKTLRLEYPKLMEGLMSVVCEPHSMECIYIDGRHRSFLFEDFDDLIDQLNERELALGEEAQ